MKYTKYLKDILLIILVSIIIYNIINYINLDKEIKIAKDKYNETKKANRDEQKKSDAEIKKLGEEIISLNTKLFNVRGKHKLSKQEIAELKKLVKRKPKWKIKEIEKITYVTLPAVDLDITLKERDICCELKDKWKLSYEEMKNKFTIEKNTRIECEKLVNVLSKRKKKKLWVYVVAGAIIGYIIAK